MPIPFMINLPPTDELREEIENGLTPYADVQVAPETFGWDEVKLIIEVVGGAAGILSNSASIVKFLLMLKDRYKKKDQPSGISIGPVGEPGVPLEDADESAIHRIVGLESKEKEE